MIDLNNYEKGNPKGSYKLSIYDKTKRFGQAGVTLYEKIDGSNLCIGKYEGVIYVFQRKVFYKCEDLVSGDAETTMKGLTDWLKEYGPFIQENLYEGSVIMGEWIANKYEELTSNSLIMFGKGRLLVNAVGEFELTNRIYDTELLHYTFINGEVPNFITLVPTVKVLDCNPTIEMLDEIYEDYNASVERNVEGFVFSVDNRPIKYVRYKNGKPSKHLDSREIRKFKEKQNKKNEVD